MNEEDIQNDYDKRVRKAKKWAEEFLNPGQFYRIKKYHKSEKIYVEIVSKKDTWKKIKSL